jgi:hypothetical protein
MAEQPSPRPFTKEMYAVATRLTNEELFYLGKKASWSFLLFTHELCNACTHAPKFVRERNVDAIKRLNENDSEHRRKYLKGCVDMGKKEFEKGNGEKWVEWWMAVLQFGVKAGERGRKDPREKALVLMNMEHVVSEYERLLECFTYT